MKTYKLGNKVKCIIRSVASGKIGEEEMIYDNQPYTVLQNVSASLRFRDVNSDIRSDWRELHYNVDNVSEIDIDDVLLTNKILNLIFQKSEVKLCNTCGNFDSDEQGKIYLPIWDQDLYQVFIYNDESELEKAYGTLTENVITVEKPNSNYIVFYSFVGSDGYNLNRVNNLYLTLDLEITNNEDNETTTTWLHLDKCALKVDKNLMFNNSMNTIDLSFKVIKTNNDYITFM